MTTLEAIERLGKEHPKVFEELIQSIDYLTIGPNSIRIDFPSGKTQILLLTKHRKKNDR